MFQANEVPYKEYTPKPEADAAWQNFKDYYWEHHSLMNGDDEHVEDLSDRFILALRSDF